MLAACLLAVASAAAQVPDLTIAKSHVGNFTQSQIGATYTITVTNVGTGAVPPGNTVTVAESFPAGITATSIGGSAWICTQPAGPCTRSGASTSLAAGASYPAISLLADVPVDAPASVTNSVTVSGGGELNTANNSASDPTTISPGPDLTIGKTHAGNFTQSQIGATYNIVVSNVGPGAVQAGNTVTVTDTFPAAITATNISGSGWICTQPSGPCTRSGSSTALAAGASYPTLVLLADIPGNAPASVTNSVVVSGGGETNIANNSASDLTTISLGPDLTIAKTHVGNITQSQIGATFHIVVSNAGPGAVQAGNTVTVTDTFPAGITATNISGSGWNCTQPSGPCTRSGSSTALAAGASYPTLVLLADVPGNATASVTNSVTVSGGGELNTANNSASDTVTIGTGPDLTIAKTHAGNFTQSQIGATFNIVVSNAGPGAVQSGNSVTVTDSFPAAISATSIGGSGWICTQPSGPCTRSGSSTALASGASYPTLVLFANIPSDAPASVTNSVTVSGGGELNTSNNSASDTVTIGTGPDLTVGKTHAANFTQGQNGATYTITVTNVGAGAVQSGNPVTVTEIVPSGLTATGIIGNNWTCTPPAGPCTRTGANTSLAPGSSYPPLTLTVNVAPNAPASVTNSVTVSGGGENNTSNNLASDPTDIGPGPDLTIAKSHAGNFIQSQIGAQYTITVTNSGMGAVQANNTVTVTDTLPPGLAPTNIAGSGWVCTQPGGPCSRSGASTTLVAGLSYPPITLTVDVSPNAPASVTNSVAVSGGGEANTGNNFASDAATIDPGPDLTIAQTHVGNFTQGQTGATYDITVSNAGPGAVLSGSIVTITDAMPVGLAATNFSGGGWNCAQPAGPCIRTGANAVLAVGASFPTITVTVDVASEAPALVTNIATVSGGGDSNSSNNSASDPTIVTGPAAKLAFISQPSDANAGVAIAPAVTVQVQDAAGLFVTSSTAPVSMAIGNNPGGATLGGTTSGNAVGGVATFATLTVNKGGAGYTLSASSAGLTSATSTPFNVLASPVLVSAVSRKTHGTAGTFDLALAPTPLNPTTETRVSAAQTIVLTFDTAIASADNPTLSEGTATFGSMTIAGNEVTLNYTGVANTQYVTYSLANVLAAGGGPVANVSLRVGYLAGDANQSRQVTVADVGIVNAALLQTVSNANFLLDINVDGRLTVADKGITNANLLKKLPAP
jgi:uncharacterized repeat protein (TIGR01451 family)